MILLLITTTMAFLPKMRKIVTRKNLIESTSSYAPYSVPTADAFVFYSDNLELVTLKSEVKKRPSVNASTLAFSNRLNGGDKRRRVSSTTFFSQKKKGASRVFVRQ